MKVALLYIVPLDAREIFRPFAKRWADSYRKFAPFTEHDIIICWSCGKPTVDDKEPFAGLRYKSFYYGEDGFDIGAAQHVGCETNYDLFVAQTSRSYYHRAGWLERMVEARQRNGDNLYGAAISYEHCPLLPANAPNTIAHVRTVFYGMSSEMWRKYPYRIDNREKGFLFESGEWNYLNFYEHIGHSGHLVTFDGIYTRKTWRSAKNGFRNGNQSACLVHDKHSDLYSMAQPAQRRAMEMAAGL